MRRSVCAFIIGCALLAGCAGPVPGESSPETIFIGSWNLQRYGDAKADDAMLREHYRSVIRDFDVFIVQEVTDKDGDAFEKLCDEVGGNYSCLLSSRAGTTTYKEQYGVFVRNGVSVIDTIDYNELNATGFERPPYRIALNKDDYTFSIYTLHTKPDNTPAEIDALERIVVDSGNVIIVGDLNADCAYYRRGSDFPSWKWKISSDTTAGKSDCAYDRIILNRDAAEEYRSSGVLRVGGEGVSDHHAVWIALRSRER